MSITLRERLKSMPPGCLIPRDWLLAELESEKPQQVRWVNTGRAIEIIGDAGLTERKLRRRAAQYERLQQSGRTAPIRVRRKTDRPTSDWLFDESDCWKWRRDRRAPRLGATMQEYRGQTSSEVEMIAEGIIRQEYP